MRARENEPLFVLLFASLFTPGIGAREKRVPVAPLDPSNGRPGKTKPTKGVDRFDPKIHQLANKTEEDKRVRSGRSLCIENEQWGCQAWLWRSNGAERPMNFG